MRLITRFITGLASLAFVFNVVQFEGMTHLSSRWENPENRKLLEDRLRINHTNLQTGQFYDVAFDHNKTEIQQYSDAYLCQSQKDVKRCKSAAQW